MCAGDLFARGIFFKPLYRNNYQGGLAVTFFQRFLISLPPLLALAAVTPSAMAYIGPGSGISVIGSLLGLLATVFIAVGAIVLFPVRRMLKKRNLEEAGESLDSEDELATAGSAAASTVETTEEPHTNPR